MSCHGQHVVPRARLRWNRFAVTLTASILLTGVLAVAMIQGTLATSFALSSRDMKVSANRIQGTGYVTYPSVVTSADGRKHPVVVIAVRSARVDGLCQSSTIPTPLGRYVLRLSFPTRTTSVQVTDLKVSATTINAGLDFSSLQLNRDAATLDAVPRTIGDPGQYGLQALGFAVDNVKVRSWSVVSGSLQGQGARMAMGRTERECF